jgi:hypothetical protein
MLQFFNEEQVGGVDKIRALDYPRKFKLCQTLFSARRFLSLLACHVRVPIEGPCNYL